MAKKYFHPKSSEELIELAGPLNKFFMFLEESYRVRINLSRGRVEIKGKKENVEEVYRILKEKQKKIQQGEKENLDEIVVYKEKEIKDENSLFITYTGKPIKAKSPHQREYIRAIEKYDITFAIGPAGTGKTFLAVTMALKYLNSGSVQRIILSRPVVEAGEKLGFLPGDFYEKINPYLAPLFDAFFLLLGPGVFQRYRKEGLIEIIPLAYMRGRTLESAFVILDEAQNATRDQMKMFLTRIGNDSKVVITGDVTQVDLEKKHRSGLIHAAKVLKGIRGIKFVYFSERDVVRHPLVKKIIKAYEKESEG